MELITDFEGRTSDKVEVEYISTISGVIPVYSIKSYHSLTQFIGYGKYINNRWGNVYLRGQTSLYNGYLSPSLLRRKIISGENQLVKEKAEAATSNTVKFSNININHRFSEYKHQINESLNGTRHFTGWNKDIIEPLLQHYGIKTHWIDIVDNIWVALWFALHKTTSTIADGREYIHMFENDDDEYGYVFLIGCDAQDKNPYQAGIYRSPSTIMVDLRKAVPSFFLRPHAQHALMLRKRSDKYENFMDYTDRIIGIAKIRVKDGLKWIGQTGLLSVQSLFPPPYYDAGYANLLNEYKKPLITKSTQWITLNFSAQFKTSHTKLLVFVLSLSITLPSHLFNILMCFSNNKMWALRLGFLNAHIICFAIQSPPVVSANFLQPPQHLFSDVLRYISLKKSISGI